LPTLFKHLAPDTCQAWHLHRPSIVLRKTPDGTGTQIKFFESARTLSEPCRELFPRMKSEIARWNKVLDDTAIMRQ
jgi:hypothetical protein